MTVFKRANSSVWQCKFTLEGVTVRESTGCTSKIEAQAWEVHRRAQVRADLEAKRLGHKHMTLYGLAESWLSVSELTHRDHRNNVSRVRKLFGDELRQVRGQWQLTVGARYGLAKDLPVEDLSQEHLVRLKAARLSEGASAATVNREMSLIQTLMGYAKSMSVVTPNPPLVYSHGRNKAASLKMTERKGKMRWLTTREEKLLLVSLGTEAVRRGNDRSAGDAYDLTLFLLDTGARYNEVAAIRWSQVNLHDGTIALYRSKVQNESLLRLPQRTLGMLKRRKEVMGSTYTYVFPKLNGRTWGAEDAPRGHATDAIQNHIEKCGLNANPDLDRVTPHTFRDTFAARLVQAGVSLWEVSKLLGHANVLMTQKYAHLSPEATGAKAAAVLDSIHGIKCPEGDNPIAPGALPDTL